MGIAREGSTSSRRWREKCATSRLSAVACKVWSPLHRVIEMQTYMTREKNASQGSPPFCPKNVDLNLLLIGSNARSLYSNRGDLIRELCELGHRVEALIPESDYLDEVETLGIPVWKYRLGRTGTNPLSDLIAMGALVRLLRQKRPRIVLTYGVKSVVYGAVAARLARVPHVYSMITGLGHAYTTKSAKTRFLRAIVTPLYRLGISLSDRVFFQNPDDEAEFISRGILRDRSKAVRINGSGVNLEAFAERPLPEGDIVFLFVGRMLTEKGIAEFVEAASTLKCRYPAARFVAVGPHDRNLPHAVGGRDLDEWRAAARVEFVGEVKDVRPWLEKCTVFVLPSYREGTPRAVLEAMSVGRPIVTTDAPGCRETVVDGMNGFLVPPRDAAELAAGMERFLLEPELIPRMASESRRIAEEKYDVRKVNRVILEGMGMQ